MERLAEHIKLDITFFRNIWKEIVSIPKYEPFDFNPEPYLNKMSLPIPIGITYHIKLGRKSIKRNLVVVDLATIPHIKVAGATFTGKSVLLHNFAISLLQIPDCYLFIIDLAYLEFSYMKNHVVFAGDLEGALEILKYLHKEMHRRKYILDEAGVVKIQQYHKKHGKDNLPYLVLIVDEFSMVCPDNSSTKEEKELRRTAHKLIADLAAMARKVGIHLIVGTQRPDKNIFPGQLKANFPGTVALKVVNEVNSRIVFDNDSAAKLPNIRDRAIWQVGVHQQEVQVMHLPVSKAKRILKTIPPNKMPFNKEETTTKIPTRPST